MNEKTVDKMEHKYTKINQVWQKFNHILQF